MAPLYGNHGLDTNHFVLRLGAFRLGVFAGGNVGFDRADHDGQAQGDQQHRDDQLQALDPEAGAAGELDGVDLGGRRIIKKLL